MALSPLDRDSLREVFVSDARCRYAQSQICSSVKLYTGLYRRSYPSAQKLWLDGRPIKQKMVMESAAEQLRRAVDLDVDAYRPLSTLSKRNCMIVLTEEV